MSAAIRKNKNTQNHFPEVKMFVLRQACSYKEKLACTQLRIYVLKIQQSCILLIGGESMST